MPGKSPSRYKIPRYTTTSASDYPYRIAVLDEQPNMTDWEAVVSQHVETVRRTVHRLVGNHADAWDCVQETFLEAVKLDRRQPVRNWPALLRHVATVRALSLLRTRVRQNSRRDCEADPTRAISREANPSRQAEASELADRLRAAVAQLPHRQAQVFCLSCFEQMTSEEVAEQVGISPTAARMLLSRARRRLQRLLEPFGIAPEERE